MTIKPCCAKSSLAEIWMAYDSHNAPMVATFSTLSRDLQQTLIWRKLALSTQRDYLDCHLHITTRKGNTGLLGDLPIAKWTVGLIRKYQDHRGESSASRHVSIMPKIVIMNLCLK